MWGEGANGSQAGRKQTTLKGSIGQAQKGSVLPVEEVWLYTHQGTLAQGRACMHAYMYREKT